jgi:hypothetical protein
LHLVCCNIPAYGRGKRATTVQDDKAIAYRQGVANVMGYEYDANPVFPDPIDRRKDVCRPADAKRRSWFIKDQDLRPEVNRAQLPRSVVRPACATPARAPTERAPASAMDPNNFFIRTSLGDPLRKRRRGPMRRAFRRDDVSLAR